MTRRRQLGLVAVLAVALVAAAGAARAMTLESNVNLVDLIRESQTIVIAQVQSVTDGIDERGFPYTEVTLSIDETIKGVSTNPYTFRQFGLMEPRPVGDGRIMMPAPAGFPRYAPGERNLLFLARPASVTGLQSTYALEAGKFTLGAGRAENGIGNQGTFTGIGLGEGLATDNDRRMLATENGAVSPDTLLSFVRRAVGESWIARKLMWKEGERATRPIKRDLTRGVSVAPSTTTDIVARPGTR